MADADADGRGVDAGGNACTAAALELRRALGPVLTTARAPTAEIGASRDLVNLVNAPTSDTLVIGSEYALHPDRSRECLGACECSPRRPPTTPHRYYQLQAPGPGLWSLSLASKYGNQGLWSLSLASGAELQSAAVPGSRYAVPSARALSARHGAATGARHGAAVPGSRYAVPSARALAVPLLSYTGTTLVDVFVGACKCSPRRPPTPLQVRLSTFSSVQTQIMA